MSSEAFKSSQNKDEEKEAEKNKTVQQKLIHIADEKIDLLFRDQFGEAFAKIFVKDHSETIPVTKSKFARLILKCFYDKFDFIPGIEAINSLVNLLQAEAEMGGEQYNLYLRVAEYQGDFYYDLTDEKHRCIRISKEKRRWEILNEPPIPLFRRYNQTAQIITHITNNELLSDKIPGVAFKHGNDKLEEFLSKLTNIKDEKTKLLIKTSIVSYFVPEISHIILLFHGPWGAAKTTLQKMIKEIVDPAKPSLLTFHQDKNEFLQQIAQNYLATFDNVKHTPKWLPEEVCKTVTGSGHSKRTIYTVDDAKIYEFKHCLIFNGINLAFYEPDVLDRSITIDLPMIKEEDRRLEKEVLDQFKSMKPDIMNFIFNTLAKAMTIYPNITCKGLPRMADFALWCEAISRSMGYKEKEFLKAYNEIRGTQNNEIVDSNPLAFVIKKFVESICSSQQHTDSMDNKSDKLTLFDGSPLKLLQELNPIAANEGIDISQKDWPKNRNWLIRKINIVKPTLRQAFGIEIAVVRDSTNSSTIRIVKNMSSISGEHEISPESENLYPYFENISPEKSNLSPTIKPDSNTISTITGDTGDTGDNKGTMDRGTIKDELIESIKKNPLEKVEATKEILDNDLKSSEHKGELPPSDNRSETDFVIYIDSRKENPTIDSSLENNPYIGYKHPFYFCKKHPNIQNIHYEEIVDHLRLSRLHRTDL
jgi:hypothetical protein